MALTKNDIIDRLVTEHGLVRREAKDFVDTFFDDIRHRVNNGERVRLIGTGTFSLKKQYYHRKRRNVEVSDETPAWHTIHFKPSIALKNRVQQALILESREVD